MSLLSQRTSVFDPLDPAFLDDPYPCYARLRAAGPMVRDGAAQWVVARHEHVARLLRHPGLRSEWPESFQQMRVGEGAAGDFLRRVLLHREGPDHTVLRRLLGSTMQATPGAALRECVARVTDARLDRALESGMLDVMADLAIPVPVAVACEMLGIPAADVPLVETWGIEIIKAFTVILPEPDRPNVDAAIEELRAYLAERLRTSPDSDKLVGIFAELRQSAEGTTLTTDELIDNLIFLLVSGFTTTVHAIAAIGAVLLRHPDVYRQLRADRALVGRAVEEILRYDAPIQHVSRFAAERIEVEGLTIRPGRVVHLLLGAANHDERQFTEPQRLDIRRDPNPHVSFGAGIHTCLGAGLGRLESTFLLERLLERCADVEAGGELVRRPVQVFRTYERLPARLTAA
ncbi:cytochrome P450 [Solihabitans fulvus]|uniref:Cytochrome P450 n=1 Tax=Solihabitans fulvus TaxID=1892852 RepID=A0A5B2XS69_9PSEU|nr:cytochrome P450 [Solihabitans fulvus]KAA2265782.1 cytochrome P450 [Solihabitans fulvus]